MHYAILHGAKENCGDFLIRDRAIDLLSNYLGIEPYTSIDVVREILSKKQLSELESCDVAFLAGGPGYYEDFVSVYPAFEQLLDRDVPVVPLGPGWKGQHESEYEFTENSLALLERLSSQDEVKYLGARDLPTVRILRNHGLPAKLTGCPAWQDPYRNPLKSPFSSPQEISSVVISSPPSNNYRLFPQWLLLLRTIAEKFPSAKKICSFHRGMVWDKESGPTSTASYKIISKIAQNLGYELYDASGSSAFAERYREIDLHVGYRVHGHIPFLASGSPSFLLQIDGRGKGVSESLGTSADEFARGGALKPVKKITENIKQNVNNNYPKFDNIDENILAARENIHCLINHTVTEITEN